MSKAPLQLLTILLIFSYVLSSNAVPTTRSLLLNWEKSSYQLHTTQGAPKFIIREENLDDMANDFMVEGRIDLESTDYPGTGANNRHVPKTPGRA